VESFESFKEEPTLLELYYELDTFKWVLIEKTYYTYLDALIKIGGLIKILGIVFTIFYWPVNQIMSNVDLIDHMFLVCLNKDQVRDAMEMIYLSLGMGGSKVKIDLTKGDIDL
jgi:hypothetical protein